MPPPSPETTLVILLGASDFPKASQFTAAKAFRNSFERIKSYFLDSEGFGLPQRNLLDLFDSDAPPSVLDGKIANFLKTHSGIESQHLRPQDVVVYYVGHGGFSGGGSDYYLALRQTSTGREYITSYPIKSLATNLNENARHLRRYIILDSCFSAAAYTSFMSSGGPLEAACLKTREEFPSRGTALLCASGPRDPAKVLPNQEFTMFSGALAQVLSKGDSDEPDSLSLARVGDLTRDIIRDLHLQEAVRPEVHSPEMREGDIAGLPLFPNPARRMSRLRVALEQLEQKIQNLESRQRQQDSAQEQVQKKFRELDLRMEKFEEGPIPVSPKIGLFGLTLPKWEEVPAVIKGLIEDYSINHKLGLIWLIFSLMTFFLTFSLSFIYRYITDSTYKHIIIAVLIVSGIFLIISINIFLRRKIIKAEETHEEKLPNGPWNAYDIVVKASKQRVVEFFPGFYMEHTYFLISSFLWLISFFALLALLLSVL